MFNVSKNSAIKENAEEFIESTKDNLADITLDAKRSAARLGRKIKRKSSDSKEDVLALIDDLKDLLEPETPSKVDQIIEQLVDQVAGWKVSIQEELLHALKVSDVTSRRLLQKRSLLTLSIAMGAGVLIGYIASQEDS